MGSRRRSVGDAGDAKTLGRIRTVALSHCWDVVVSLRDGMSDGTPGTESSTCPEHMSDRMPYNSAKMRAGWNAGT